MSSASDNKLIIMELAFRKALADKFYLASPQRKLTLDAEFVTAALNKYVQQVTDGWTDRGFTRHAE